MILSSIASLISAIAPVTLWHFNIIGRRRFIAVAWIIARLTTKRHSLCFGFVRVTAWGRHATYFNETWKITNKKISHNMSTPVTVLGQHCSWLSTVLNNIVEPESAQIKTFINPERLLITRNNVAPTTLLHPVCNRI